MGLQFTLSFLLAISTSLANADWSRIPAKDFQLAPPPLAGSVEEQRDFEIILEKQNLRSEDECALSGRQLRTEFEVLYRETNLLSQNERQKLRPLMDRVVKFTDHVTDHYKAKYRRPRPYDKDHRIHPCIEVPGGRKSYPSSHASISWTTACLLAQIYPERAIGLKDYGIYLGELRVIVGVHYPSDVRAGRELGDQICRLIWSDPTFQTDLTERYQNVL